MKATHFRIWATNTLREFIVKGFALNDLRLKKGRSFCRATQNARPEIFQVFFHSTFDNLIKEGGQANQSLNNSLIFKEKGCSAYRVYAS